MTHCSCTWQRRGLARLTRTRVQHGSSTCHPCTIRLARPHTVCACWHMPVVGNTHMRTLLLERIVPCALPPCSPMQLQELDRQGVLIRGNLRDERTKVFAHVCAKVGIWE